MAGSSDTQDLRMGALIRELTSERVRAQAPARRDNFVLPDELYWMVQDMARLEAVKDIIAKLWAKSFAPLTHEGSQQISQLEQIIDSMQRKISIQIRTRYS